MIAAGCCILLATLARHSQPTHVKDLIPDPQNRRAHNPRNIGMVVDALHQVGAARSIVIDEDNVILAGNGVTEAAAEAGITKVRVVEADGHEIIAVRRSGLTADQKRTLAIADNRTAELATWNVPQLQDDLEHGFDLSPFFSEAELSALFKVSDIAGAAASDDPSVRIGQCGVIVVCQGEAEQQTVYEDLSARGYTCKVVNT